MEPYLHHPLVELLRATWDVPCMPFVSVCMPNGSDPQLACSVPRSAILALPWLSRLDLSETGLVFWAIWVTAMPSALYRLHMSRAGSHIGQSAPHSG